MSEPAPEKSPWPPIAPNTRVKTTQSDTARIGDWQPASLAEQKWGVGGKIISHSDSHGLCYQVEHDDGSKAWYNPSELEVLSES